MTDTIKISRKLNLRVVNMLQSYVVTLAAMNFPDNDEGDYRQCANEGQRSRVNAAVNELRALLATPPADAADMGGQAGEEVEVVAWRGVNELGEVVTEWIDGVPPERMADMCGNPASYARIDLAYSGPNLPKIANAEVDVVAFMMRPDMYEPYVHIRRDNMGGNGVVEPLMTVAQHRRILAQHRQQAGGLVEALRLIANADPLVVTPKYRIAASEALADWEKTSCGK